MEIQASRQICRDLVRLLRAGMSSAPKDTARARLSTYVLYLYCTVLYPGTVPVQYMYTVGIGIGIGIPL